MPKRNSQFSVDPRNHQFAVFINFIEGAVTDHSRIAKKALSLIDDGGELVISSIALVVALSIWRRSAAADPVSKQPH